jgi:hypothetical protein
MAEYVDFKALKAVATVEAVAARYGVELRQVNASHKRGNVRSRRILRGTRKRRSRSTSRSGFGYATRQPARKVARGRRAAT